MLKLVQDHIDAEKVENESVLLTKYARLIIPDKTTTLYDHLAPTGSSDDDTFDSEDDDTFDSEDDDNTRTINEQVKNIEKERELNRPLPQLYNRSTDIQVSQIAPRWDTPGIKEQVYTMEKERELEDKETVELNRPQLPLYNRPLDTRVSQIGSRLDVASLKEQVCIMEKEREMEEKEIEQHVKILRDVEEQKWLEEEQKYKQYLASLSTEDEQKYLDIVRMQQKEMFGV